MSSTLNYVIDCLRRSADSSDCWPVYPAEAGALVAEIERLRKENEELRGERAAAVAYLRKEARAPGASPDERTILTWASNYIDRGEHRRGDKP